MEIRMKWYYRLGFLLLIFIVLFVFMRLRAMWFPVVKVLFITLLPFIIAAFITYLLHPIIEKLNKRGLNRGLAVILIYVLFFGGVGISLYKGIPIFLNQLQDLTKNSPQLMEQYRSWIHVIQNKTASLPDGLQEKIDEGINSLEKAVEKMMATALKSVMNLANSIVTIAIIPFIAFYMLKDIHLMKKAVWYITPKQWREQGRLFLQDVDESLGSYIRGQLLVCSIIGVTSALLFWIVGMKYPLLLGLIVGVTNIIPYFGPIIGAIPAVVIAATISLKMALIALLIIFPLQFLEGNIISPFIVGKSLHMHPLVIMLSLLIGGEIAGITGLLIAVPIVAILKVAVIHARNHFIRKNSSEENLDFEKI